MTKAIISMNCNCFTNRWTEPEEWTRLCAEELGIDTVQYCIDLLDPYYPWDLQRKIMDQTLAAADRYGICIKSSFGGQHSHQHYLGHPDEDVRRESENWFRRCIDQTAYLGAEGFGTCFAIMSVADNRDPFRREMIMQDATQAYYRLAEYGKEKGLKYLSFETTSVDRESCATISETRQVMDQLADTAIPMMLCLDVGHRNMGSDDPRDADHLAWIRAFGKETSVIHLQQTDTSASCHWPFSEEYNQKGIIDAKEVVTTVLDHCEGEILLALELGAKAYHPHEDNYISNMKVSVNYWKTVMDGKTWKISEPAIV